jgi:C4-dicarboxylate-specific signal transduction histidine kinase
LLSHDADERITEANLTLAKLLHVERSQLIGQHVGKLIAPADHASFIQHLSQLHNTATHNGQASAGCIISLITTQQTLITVRLESTLQTASVYSEATIHTRICPLEHETHPQCLADLQKEIAERELAEEQARQHQEKLAHVARLNTMGEMASGLAHELNQPLTAIRSYTQSCLRLLDGHPEKQSRVPKILGLVNVQAKRAASIIKHLRDFVSKSATHRETTELLDIVQLALSMMQHELRDSDIKLTVDTAPNLPAVRADAIQLEQVVLNLLRNACEAMRENTLKRRQLNIALEHINARQVRIAICDTGPGISDDAAGKISAPFFSTKEDGMGLGLAISRTIVEDHGGKLSYENNAQGGATFAFTLAINGQRPPIAAEKPKGVSP